MPERLRPDGLDTPHPSRFSAAHPGYEVALAAHRAAMGAGQAGYPDPTSGLFVLCAAYLVARGSCCDSGCRHCPYLDATV